MFLFVGLWRENKIKSSRRKGRAWVEKDAKNGTLGAGKP
jgi:hypothetical protein